MIAAGRLRHLVNLQGFTTTVNPDTGDRTRTWTAVAQLWAAVDAVSGREFIAAAASQSAVSTRITIRFRAGVSHAMRIVHRGLIYNIEAVLPDKGSGLEYLTLMCSEGTDDG